MIKLDLTGVKPFMEKTEWQRESRVHAAHDALLSGLGEDCGYTSWVNLPESYDRAEFRRIKAAAERIKSDSDVLLVIGIGGSYLGARAGIELLRSPNYNLISKHTPHIYYVGNNLSGEHINEIGHLLRGKNFSINVVSKSGETLEPMVAFRIFKDLLVNRYGNIGARGRVYVTTGRAKGALRQIAEREGFESFTIPDKITGRHSILTAAGLLPMAVSGIDIDRVMAGAFDAMQVFTTTHGFENPAWQYAAVRQALYRKGKAIEVLAAYEPAFHYLTAWWKHLYAESEGRDGGGMFPVNLDYTSDLHAVGQYLQEGARNLMETVISVKDFRRDIAVPRVQEDLDELNYLAGCSVQRLNAAAKRAAKEAHMAGDVPYVEIMLSEMGEAQFGWLIYFFQFACGLSGHLQDLKRLDQAGVEVYKQNMSRLLGSGVKN